MKVFANKRILVSLLVAISVLAVGVYAYFFLEPSTYFDFARFAELAEVILDGKVFLKSGQVQMDPSLNATAPSVLRVAMSKESTQRRAFYNVERRSIHFRKRRAVFINLHPSSLQYYLEIPHESKLEFAFIAEGDSPSVQVVSPAVQVECLNGKQLSYSDRLSLQQTKELEIRNFHKLDLSAVAGQVCKFTFKIESEHQLSSGTRVGWLDPRLTVSSHSAKTEHRISSDQRAKLNQLRELNQDSNLIIMLLDASNRSHFSAYGYDRNTTPVIDSLGKQGVVFDNAFCQSVYTLSSTADLFTSTTSLLHGVLNKETKLLPDFVTLPEVLHKKGFRTASFTASANSSSTFGFDQGFEEMFELFRTRHGKTLLAEKFLDPVSKWLEKNGRQRFFLYIHFREPHLPLIAPDPFRKMFDPDYNGEIVGTFRVVDQINKGELTPTPRDLHHLIALYDANVAYVDHVAGQILEKLKQMNLYDNTTILILSDHGEGLWEHGYEGHNIHLYEESIRIPLIFHFNHRDVPLRQRVNQMVRTIDLYPTILDLFDVDGRSNPFAQGRSVLPYLFSNEDDADLLVLSHTVNHLDFSLRTIRYKYILWSDEKEVLYDLKSDPNETQNILQNHQLLAGYFRFTLKHLILDQQQKRREFGIKNTEAPTIDSETQENLKALGYVN